MKQRKSTEEHIKVIHILSKSQEVRACSIVQGLKRLAKEGYVTISAQTS